MRPEKAERIVMYVRVTILAAALIWVLYGAGRLVWYEHVEQPKLDAITDQKIADIKREGKKRGASIIREGNNCLDKGGMPVMGYNEWHVICVDRKVLIHVYEETKDASVDLSGR